MKISIQGKNIDVGDALRGHIETGLTGQVQKYFTNPTGSEVTVTKDAHLFKTEIKVHIGKEMKVQGSGKSENAYSAVDEAMERIAKQLRRYKRRLRDHHKTDDSIEFFSAPDFIFAGEPEDHHADYEDGQDPIIIAESQANIATLAVADAVMRMDLSNAPMLMFKNSTHGGLNVVYRRPDGNIGWIDPQWTGTGNT